VDFTNAYGLTETSSTIAFLGPDDHRAAIASDDPAVRRRLGSVGRPAPAVEIEIHDDEGRQLPPETTGFVVVRGAQVSGEYVGAAAGRDWFETRDLGFFDLDGYLYLAGRADDTIIRGGENIAPAEIEDAILRHPHVAECAVVGIPDETWGQRIAAVVVEREGAALTEADVKEWVREWLRSSKTPDLVIFRHALPMTTTGKILRRVLGDELSGASALRVRVGDNRAIPRPKGGPS